MDAIIITLSANNTGNMGAMSVRISQPLTITMPVSACKQACPPIWMIKFSMCGIYPGIDNGSPDFPP